MGSGEIVKRLGISRQRVNQLSKKAHWPLPYDTLIRGPVWRIEDIERVFEHRPELDELAALHGDAAYMRRGMS